MTIPFEQRPRLIQRVKVSPSDSKGIDGAFSFDYMGAAEFEFGTASNSLKLMREADRGLLGREKWKPIKLSVGDCWYVGPSDRIQIAEELLADQLGPKEWNLKEATFIRESFEFETDKNSFFRFDGWWAVTQRPGHSGTSDQPVPFIIFKERKHADLWLKRQREKL